jgi:hypothetical protein
MAYYIFSITERPMFFLVPYLGGSILQYYRFRSLSFQPGKYLLCTHRQSVFPNRIYSGADEGIAEGPVPLCFFTDALVDLIVENTHIFMQSPRFKAAFRLSEVALFVVSNVSYMFALNLGDCMNIWVFSTIKSTSASVKKHNGTGPSAIPSSAPE